MIKKSYKFRLYPTAHQETLLKKTLELCRWTYNETLAYKRDMWVNHHKSVSKYDTHKLLTAWKVTKPALNDTYTQFLQEAQSRVNFTFNVFYRKLKRNETSGYPRFKGVNQYCSFTAPQCETGGAALIGDHLRISKVGLVKLDLHRQLSTETVIKQAVIKLEVNKWCVFLLTESPSEGTIDHPEEIVGIDLGCSPFATLSTGESVDNPKFLTQSEKRLGRIYRKLSSYEEGTKERAKTSYILAHVHKKILNRRNDFSHKLSRKLTQKYKYIVVEDLEVKQMTHTSLAKLGLKNAILDSGWAKFVRMCSYKAENAGGKVVLVDPRNTSQMCSRCGAHVQKKLSERTHSCPICKLVMDRDLNAAINILRLGQQSLAKVA